MGGSSSKVPHTPLPPQPSPIGLFPPFIWQSQVTLQLKEKAFSFSGDDFSITDTAGTPVFKFKGQALNIRDKKVLLASNGQPILNVTNKLISIHKAFYIRGGDSTDNPELARVTSHFALVGAKLNVTFKNVSDGRDITLDVKGDWISREAEITLDGIAVARISRSYMNANELVFGQQTYYLTVAPGVDAALMVAVCVCLDEKRSEGK